MLRTSCLLLIDSCFQLGLIDEDRRRRCCEYIQKEDTHIEIRNLIMMILLPRKLHMDDHTQGAYLRAAVSRVRSISFSWIIVSKIANPTLMEKRGVDFLYPIWSLTENKLRLDTDDTSVFYTVYINDFKRPLQQNEISINEAINDRLTPGILFLLFMLI